MVARQALAGIFRAALGPHPAYTVRLTFANGRRCDLPGVLETPDIEIVFRTRAAEWRTLLMFYAGLLDAYVDGAVDLIGDRPIAKLSELSDAFRKRSGRGNKLVRLFMPSPIVRLRQYLQEARQNNKNLDQAKRNAIFHYGLDPEFFGHLLGGTVGYSEGYWPDGTRTLDQAKFNNYDLITRKLRLAPGLKVVEVGAGWGYMPLLMAERYGADVTVYNPVPRQNAYMSERFARHGFDSAIRLVEKDHRELRHEPDTYDRYVSIGVYEHVGKDGYRDWIESIATALKPGGIGVLSTTCRQHKALTEYLTLKYVFPGGHVPSLPLTVELMERLGLTVIEIENLWPHYRRTMDCWLTNLETRWDDIARIDPQTFTERFRRTWIMYLAGAGQAFQNDLDLAHITFVKGRAADAYPVSPDFLDRAAAAKGDDEVPLYP